MPLVSAVPGTTVATTLQLAAPARAPVAWTLRDPAGNVVDRGQVAPSGTLVAISFVLAANAMVPTDGSRYTLDASDGTTSVRDYIEVVSPVDMQVAASSEVAYMSGQPLQDTLVLGNTVDSITVTGYLADGSIFMPETAIDTTDSTTRVGDAYCYRLKTNTPVNMKTGTSMGTGTLIWTYQTDTDLAPSQEFHSIYTITPYSTGFLSALRNLVDRARIGDANKYLQITASDLAHALMRGADFVSQAQPVLTPFTLDQLPITLRDYIVKAGAIDLLRAQVQAEGMSAFDMQGQGVQLTVDRTQYLNSLIEELSSDMQGLMQAKNNWLAQGGPMGANVGPGKRVIGHLGLTTGTYTNQPQVPLPIIMAASGTYSFLRFGPFR